MESCWLLKPAQFGYSSKDRPGSSSIWNLLFKFSFPPLFSSIACFPSFTPLACVFYLPRNAQTRLTPFASCSPHPTWHPTPGWGRGWEEIRTMVLLSSHKYLICKSQDLSKQGVCALTILLLEIREAQRARRDLRDFSSLLLEQRKEKKKSLSFGSFFLPLPTTYTKSLSKKVIRSLQEVISKLLWVLCVARWTAIKRYMDRQRVLFLTWAGPRGHGVPGRGMNEWN